MKIMLDKELDFLGQRIVDLEEKVWALLEDEGVCAQTAMTTLLYIMANIIATEVPRDKREPVYRFFNAGIRNEVEYLVGGEAFQ